MVKIWIELEMRLSVSPWLGLLCMCIPDVSGIPTERVRYELAVQVQLQPRFNTMYDCLSKLILQTLTMDGIGDCEILDK